MIKAVADSKTMAITGKVVKFIHVNPCTFIRHNLENNN